MDVMQTYNVFPKEFRTLFVSDVIPASQFACAFFPLQSDASWRFIWLRLRLRTRWIDAKWRFFSFRCSSPIDFSLRPSVHPSRSAASSNSPSVQQSVPLSQKLSSCILLHLPILPSVGPFVPNAFVSQNSPSAYLSISRSLRPKFLRLAACNIGSNLFSPSKPFPLSNLVADSSITTFDPT